MVVVNEILCGVQICRHHGHHRGGIAERHRRGLHRLAMAERLGSSRNCGSLVDQGGGIGERRGDGLIE